MPTHINDDKGSLSDIEKLANDASKGITAEEASSAPITIEGAKEKGSMQEFVQQELDKARGEGKESSPDSNTNPEQKPDNEAEVEAARLAEEERKNLQPPTEENEEEVVEETPEALEQKAAAERQRKLDERLDQHPRFQELNRRVREQEPWVANAKMDAEFCEKNRILPEQKKTAMELVALVNSDPVKARDALAKIIENIDLATGKSLPADLAKEVTDGTMSKERATELHMARMAVQQAKAQATQTQKQQLQTYQQQINQSQNQWDMAKRRQDPDFAPKKPGAEDGKWELVNDLLIAKAAVKPPTTIKEAVDQLEACYAQAHKIFSKLSPPPRARRFLGGNQRSSEPQTAEPKAGESMQDFVKRTVLSKAA